MHGKQWHHTSQESMPDFLRSDKRPRVRPEGKDIYQRSISSLGVASALHNLQTNNGPQNLKPSKKKKPPKNFIARNRNNVDKNGGVRVQVQPLDLASPDRNRIATPPQHKYIHVQSKVSEYMKSRPHSVEPCTSKSADYVKHRSSSVSRPNTPKRPASSSSNFVLQNIKTASSAPIRRAQSVQSLVAAQTKEERFRQNHKFGEVPKYIVDKATLARNLRDRQRDNDIPRGHRLVEGKEKSDTLKMLQKTHDSCMSQLNSLPIRTDTMKLQKRKATLETNLVQLEDAMDIFSRPRVYVKED